MMHKLEKSLWLLFEIGRDIFQIDASEAEQYPQNDCSEPSLYVTTRQLATSISLHQSTSQAQPAPQVLLDTHVKMNFVLKMQHPDFHFHMIS